MKIAQSVTAAPAEPAARVQLRDHRVADARPHAGRDPGGRSTRRSRGLQAKPVDARRAGSRQEPDSSPTPSAAWSACSRAPSACSRTTSCVGDPGFVTEDLRRYRAVDAAAIQRAAQQYLKKDGARGRDRRSQPRRAHHGTGEEVTPRRAPVRRARAPGAGAVALGCASAPPPARRRAATAARAAAPAARRAGAAARAAGAAAPPGRETPDAPFRQLAPPPGGRADVQAAAAEALQAEERPRGDAGRVPRPSAGRLQPDDQDRRRRQPARSGRAGRSDRAHARRGDQDAHRARHRRPGRVAGRARCRPAAPGIRRTSACRR